MLLPLSHHCESSFPPKAPPFQFHPSTPPPSFFLFPPPFRSVISPKTKPSKSLIRSAIADSERIPKSAIQRIADKLRSLGFTDENSTETRTELLGHRFDWSWSSPENPVPVPGSGNVITRFNEIRRETKRQKQLEKGLWKKREVRVPTLAEVSLSVEELRRLQGIGIGVRKKVKVGKAGVTERIVNGIHEFWRHSEIVKIVCEDFCKMNMKRTHDLLERKTGGLVVWRSGSKVLLYRGANYKYPYFFIDDVPTNTISYEALPDSGRDSGGHDEMVICSSGTVVAHSAGPSPTYNTKSTLIKDSPSRLRFQLPAEAQLREEANRLIDGLGPRYTDWWGYDPLPVDADLVPAIVTGFKRPFRLLPYGVQPILTNDEMTTLRTLGRPLPCHFALGRNRGLQGLAASIIKLWEKCEIAKVAVKRGVSNTNSKMMAEELKRLTGGTLVSRDKEFIIFYRGKDFLPSAVSSAIEDWRKHDIHGEKQRTECGTVHTRQQDPKLRTMECNSKDEFDKTNAQKKVISEEKKLRSSEAAIKRTSMKLSLALEKKEKAEKLLAELEKAQIPQPLEIDREGITEEERYMLRKVGLRMKPFLLLGRRGVFAGTVENMHLHWKYRELVKLICNEKSHEDVHRVAQILEAESGGILVAVERVNKGYAVIIYRGKNYKPPPCLRPCTLLDKRKAMKRSLEAQRRESLKLRVLKLTRNIEDLRLQLVKKDESQLPNSVKSVDESRLLLINKLMNTTQSAEHVELDVVHQSGHCSDSKIPSCDTENEARDNHEASATFSSIYDCFDTSVNGLLFTQPDKINDFSSKYDGGDGSKIELECSSESSEGMSTSIMANAEHCISGNDPIKSSVKSTKIVAEPSAEVALGNELTRVPFEAICLSNRNRLLLRKQALKMKKQPVLAIGRTNIVAGIAKAIKEHFRKHPLVIVNVKGRAKGTSVQEVVFKLEQATGAVLVSQEPSNVILYRGWGARYESSNSSTKYSRNLWKKSVVKEVEARPAASPDLLTTIKLERR